MVWQSYSVVSISSPPHCGPWRLYMLSVVDWMEAQHQAQFPYEPCGES
jgi:hypothetical protein